MAPELTASGDDSELNNMMPEAWRWMAPELFQTSMVGYTQRVTQATDVWAFAMTVIEVCASGLFTLRSS
jgi:hypothetical protein